MKITICGSIAFIDQMSEVKTQLEAAGHQVFMPPLEKIDGNGNPISVKEYYTIRHSAAANEEWVWDEKKVSMIQHFEKVALADAILVLNYDKNNIPGYIGANTLMEIGLAMYLQKKIYLFNDIPKMSYTEEILGAKPVVLHGSLSGI